MLMVKKALQNDTHTQAAEKRYARSVQPEALHPSMINRYCGSLQVSIQFNSSLPISRYLDA